MIIKLKETFIDTVNINSISPIRKEEAMGLGQEDKELFCFYIYFTDGGRESFSDTDQEKLELKQMLIAQYWCGGYEQDTIPEIK